MPKSKKSQKASKPASPYPSTRAAASAQAGQGGGKQQKKKNKQPVPHQPAKMKDKKIQAQPTTTSDVVREDILVCPLTLVAACGRRLLFDGSAVFFFSPVIRDLLNAQTPSEATKSPRELSLPYSSPALAALKNLIDETPIHIPSMAMGIELVQLLKNYKFRLLPTALLRQLRALLREGATHLPWLAMVAGAQFGDGDLVKEGALASTWANPSIWGTEQASLLGLPVFCCLLAAYDAETQRFEASRLHVKFV